MDLEGKIERLESIIRQCQSAVIAFSGGVDSSVVCAAAHKVLGNMAVAVTAVSSTYQPEELEVARSVAERIGIRHLTIATDELEDENFASNPPDRCYYCKGELFGKLDGIRRELGFRHILDGTNHEDLSDYRPGLRAAGEFKVVSPLALAGMTKEDARRAALAYGLPNADKPANPCLVSRIPYGARISPEKLNRIAEAERFIRSLGFKVVRLRDHGDLARIEVGKDELELAFKLRAEIVEGIKKLGYKFVTLDLEGYRSGSLNPLIELRE